MASKLSVIENYLKTKLKALFPSYTVYTSWIKGGFPVNKFIQIEGSYLTSANDTEGITKLNYQVDIYIGLDFSCLGEAEEEAAKEEIREAVEKILKLSISPISQEIRVYESVNAGNPCQVADFTIIYK